MIKAKIYVSLKPSVLDPQGQVISNALNGLGYEEVLETRVSKYFEIKFNHNDLMKADIDIHQICDKVLANPNTEIYHFETEVYE